jgi:hypothetical protein
VRAEYEQTLDDGKLKNEVESISTKIVVQALREEPSLFERYRKSLNENGY